MKYPISNFSDVERVVGESGCSVLFSNLHLEVNCGSFSAYYDGFMNGHIRYCKHRNYYEAIYSNKRYSIYQAYAYLLLLVGNA